MASSGNEILQDVGDQACALYLDHRPLWHSCNSYKSLSLRLHIGGTISALRSVETTD